jgi:hypothetical protein
MLPEKIEEVQDIVANLNSYLKKLLGIQLGTTVDSVFDLSFSFIEGGLPVIGNAIQNLQIRNLKKGLKAMNQIVSEVQVTLTESQEQFVKEEAMPLILKKITKEEQGEKIDIMMNGLESILSGDIEDNDSFYEFYDVLDSLRTKEVARMMQLYNKEMEGKQTYYINGLSFNGTSTQYIDNKLEQLGIRKSFIIDYGTWDSLENPQEDTAFTEFGLEFIKFFRSRNKG